MTEKQVTHTPGPWELVQERDYLNLQEKDTNLVIAQFMGASDEDARLIAAAPEMHEVLKEIFRLSEIGLSQGILYGKPLVTEMGTENIHTHEKVRAILRKVEGETE